ncbi:class III extradiol dioxygenase family protein [Azohydromonas sp.]|uniref:class III extradiol dioxygenase family protein n=1 Tax=Azohydromonas sp. TaxID=1872666 RepID=UPI002CEE2CC6|nr:class III extradiol dioxygenase family protein [Azohydromonas sp.]HMM85178.1 class III extradiol dioxygenase family protein [Azohydromonas sp.]
MAVIVGSVMTSHVPAIGGAIAKGLQDEPYWKPFFDGFAPVRRWLAAVRPDVAVVFYNDHGLNFFLDKMPTFAIGAAPEYRNADEGWGLPPLPPFAGDEDLSWHLVESLVADDFDMVTCQEMLVDHAFTLPMALLWPDQRWPVRVVPVCINTVLFPLPSAARCHRLGQAVGRAVQAWDADARVLVLGTGGLSHQLEGTRAGHLNKAFDLQFIDSLTRDPLWATRFSINDLVKQVGTQGIELLMWLAARGALPGAVAELHRNYHIPISNTASGLLLLEHRG